MSLLSYNSPDLPYQDKDSGTPTPALGTRVVGDDGHDYVFVKASAAIATLGTDVVITEPAFTVASGAGGFETVVASVANGNYTWVRRTTI